MDFKTNKFKYLFRSTENLQGENPGCTNRFSSYLVDIINQGIKEKNKPSFISDFYVDEHDLSIISEKCSNLYSYIEDCYTLQLEKYKHYLSLLYKLLLTKILKRSESIISTIIDRIMDQSVYFKQYNYNFENYLFYNNHPLLYLELPKIYSCLCFNGKEVKIQFSTKPFTHSTNCLSEYIIFKVEVLFNYYKNKSSFECKTICTRKLNKNAKV